MTLLVSSQQAIPVVPAKASGFSDGNKIKKPSTHINEDGL